MFRTGAGESLAHFNREAPAPGERAPDFVLTNLRGTPVLSDDVFGERPVVLQLGSYTCCVFRYRRFDMQPLRYKYRGRVTFLVVYTQEAHPVGTASPYADEEWMPWMNRVARIRTRQPQSFERRVDQARFAQEVMRSNAEFLVDAMNNSVWRAYGRAPSAAFVIDSHGNVVLRQPWIEPKSLSAALDEILND